MEYDIIGDVHGHVDPLEALLEEHGYRYKNGAFRHSNPNRMAIFVGDYVDRGPEQLKTIDLIRRMQEAGSAIPLMGNHEYNAIGYATPDPDRPRHYLRIRGSKNRSQHKVFLDQAGEDSALHRELVGWMKTLPLFFEDGPVRVSHACWHPDQVAILAERSRDGVLDEAAIVETFRKDSALHAAAEIVLKGLEHPLPEGVFFHDKDGMRREKTRLRWWDETATTFAAAAVAELGIDDLPEIELPAEARVPHERGKLVFFGHYWMSGTPALLSPTKACVDFSIAKDGVLCSYSWRGEPELDPANLTWVGGPTPTAALRA